MTLFKKNRENLPIPQTENLTGEPVLEPLQKSGQQVSGKWIEVWGLQVYYRTAGERGFPVLLVHGGGSDFSGFSWKYTIEALAGDHRVIAVDLPGYGQSRKPNLSFAYFDRLGIDLKQYPRMGWKNERINPFWFHIHFVKAFLDALGLEKVNLAGISMGGGIALGFTLNYSAYVRKLILVDSHGLGETLPGFKLMYLFTRIPFLYEILRWFFQHSRKLVALGMRQLIYSKKAMNDEIIEDAWKTLKDSGMHETWKAFQLCEILPTRFRTHFTGKLPEINVPVLIVHGDKDRIIPVSWVVRAQRLIPNSKLVVFEECGHLPPREKPGEFVQLLSDFLI